MTAELGRQKPQFRAAFKFGRRVHFALLRKMQKNDYSRISHFNGLNKSPKLKDGQHLRRNSRVTLNTAMNDFNPDQFKIWMKKVAAQVYFYLYLNAFLSPELFGAWKLAHICPIKILLTYISVFFNAITKTFYSGFYTAPSVYFVRAFYKIPST